jgi:thiamine biosynthesis lipoprotein
MGTVVSFSIRETTAETATDVAAAALARATASLQTADDVFSTWKPQSPLSRLRRGEITLDQAPPEVADVLALCREARDISGGWFDPWSLPGGVDPTGLVKGWAAQRALDEFKNAGVPAAMINAGGDIAVYGEPEPGQPWRIGVRHPQAADRLLCVVEISGRGAVATSGNYERGEHMIVPGTGEHARALASATVIGPDLTFADALATALFASGGEALERIARLRGYSAFVVDAAGVFRATHNLPVPFKIAA